ncbi:OsmC family protein [Pseudemcibacter aquimaris]|uniref:OsmC family protein n=1 Tax=Pseudemcibacter aquimaris TaxID=2857064 RepID=UPI0020119CBE|nr:OsmC family protein [Pseudemcibacter aquimaris]MCC3861237.1 OsmC family protein [Pseudemcibacter aquimaris]WDU58012.1 OsmC family protein [Pseudemcibacter aquimaris]
MADKTSVTISESGAGKFTNKIVTSSGHVLIADEPTELGGDDLGPNPYDYLLSALGACKSMTMRMYAAHKGFKLEHVDVTLNHYRIHAKDCEKCETTKGLVDIIDTEISISGDLTDDERRRIFAIAEKCPVQRTIMNEVVINSNLV